MIDNRASNTGYIMTNFEDADNISIFVENNNYFFREKHQQSNVYSR